LFFIHSQGALLSYLKSDGKQPMESPKTEGLLVALPLIAQLAVTSPASASSVAPPESELRAILAAASRLTCSKLALRHTLVMAGVLLLAMRSPAASLTQDNVLALARAVPVDLVGDSDEAAAQLVAEIESVFEALASSESYSSAVNRWGKACNNPGTFQGALLAILTGIHSP
jgi:hypothetical protein